MGFLVDYILGIHDFPALATKLMALHVARLFQLLDCRVNGVYTLFADGGEAALGVVPLIREGEHHGQQPLRFQRELRILQVMIAHHRVIVGALYTKYRHSQSSFLAKLNYSHMYGSSVKTSS